MARTFTLNLARIGEPARYETAEAKESPMQHHKRGLNWVVMGYGARIPSVYMVHYRGRWRRVYVACYGNCASAYIGKNLAEGIRVLDC